jgi:uncharacterized protein (DUF2126 family)
VTKPYTEYQWSQIDQLGKHLDVFLEDNDVRLTQGGEPTFVSIDDMESAQWNTEALGAEKLRLAKDLLLRLKRKFGANGLLHYGQGKWYPGEELPRWALGVFWRTDGESLWQDEKYLARVDRDYGLTVEDAYRFGTALCDNLGLSGDFLNEAYEDVFHYLVQEQRLPANLDLKKANLKDDLERKRLARLLERGLGAPTGYALPLAWDAFNQRWASCFWKFRQDNLQLIPGDSPMGLRLPLGSLELDEDGRLPVIPERDPMEPRGPLPSHADLTSTAPQKIHAQKLAYNSLGFIYTTLCIEPREGRLHLFLPPMEYLEHYVALIGMIEKTATDLKMAVVIEGYEPPKDSRLQKLLVTPDPGVIEVNVHPANNWEELRNTTLELYEEARQSRLGTEKFMLDGRHTGTGRTPADSPLLRRPDLLQSLVTFWQHHPSLSYLFSGTFIGPTSQAPRVDEGREEMLYELEIAFQQIQEDASDRPWVVDRIMRNLLVDITGNTHRSEFCIDKLYAPGAASGRLGILEFRGFEMPPHAQMSLVQALLLRALLVRFWKAPYKKTLVRWGTELHDRFMLPHYVWEDVREVVRDLNDHGVPFQLEWLLPFEEFRFPHYGRVQIDDIEMELRWAIEPWHVLGEEISMQGTSRYVDSSVERMQLRVTGMTEGRHVVSCNGRPVPLRPTGRKGEFVAGIRYRAWAPPSALHPTIGTHTPLVLDLIDTWNGHSIGGCTYHVSHPGGRSYETFPVNAMEAESRRSNRFWDYGHTPGGIPFGPQHLETDGNVKPDIPVHSQFDRGAVRSFHPHKGRRPMAPPHEESNFEYPHTLDMRRRFF